MKNGHSQIQTYEYDSLQFKDLASENNYTGYQEKKKKKTQTENSN